MADVLRREWRLIGYIACVVIVWAIGLWITYGPFQPAWEWSTPWKAASMIVFLGASVASVMFVVSRRD